MQGPEAIAASANPQFRFFVVAKNPDLTPQTDVKGTWMVAGPDTITQLTAVGYFMGRELQKKLNRPFGLIESDWGGTAIESWTSLDALKKFPWTAGGVDNTQKRKDAEPQDAAGRAKTLADFQAVVNVHLIGAAVCCQAVWPLMRAANYGRILMTTSSSGLYGNFGQSNYGAAKTGLIGLMNVLQIEGAKHDIRVNALSPGAATRMTEGLMPAEMLVHMTPESVTPAALFLVSEDAPRRTILCAIAGGFSRLLLQETEGVFLPEQDRTPEAIAALFGQICDQSTAVLHEDAVVPAMKFVDQAAAAAKRPA